MDEREPTQPEADLSNEAGEVEGQNIRNEMAAIELDIEAGNPLTPELLGHFQELGGRLADQEPSLESGQLARFYLAYDSAALKFKAGFIEAAIDDLVELGDVAYAAGEAYAEIVTMADDRRAEYVAALARQPKP